MERTADSWNRVFCRRNLEEKAMSTGRMETEIEMCALTPVFVHVEPYSSFLFSEILAKQTVFCSLILVVVSQSFLRIEVVPKMAGAGEYVLP